MNDQVADAGRRPGLAHPVVEQGPRCRDERSLFTQDVIEPAAGPARKGEDELVIDPPAPVQDLRASRDSLAVRGMGELPFAFTSSTMMVPCSPRPGRTSSSARRTGSTRASGFEVEFLRVHKVGLARGLQFLLFLRLAAAARSRRCFGPGRRRRTAAVGGASSMHPL
jgi:hypothetical protein